MIIENISAGIVLTAQSFNPTIFTEVWLDKNNIIKAGSFEGASIFSSDVTQFQTKEVQVLVLPQKMQILFNITKSMADYELPFKISKETLRLLPHIPYQALGLNFDFFVSFPDENYGALNRSMLGSGDYSLIQEFSTDDSRFGRYFSKNYSQFRLRLNIMPVKVGPENRELSQFSFNFNYIAVDLDLTERAAKLKGLIDDWESLRAYAAGIVHLGTTMAESK